MDRTSNKKFTYAFLLAIPIINAIASNTTEYFTVSAINTGISRAAIFALFSFYFILHDYPGTRLGRFFLLFLLFYAILVLWSSDMLYSAIMYIKLFISVIMLLVGYRYINNFQKFRSLILVLFFALILHIINIFISNIFDLGSSDYIDETFYFGSGRVNITKSIISLVILAPLTIILYKKYKWYLIIVYLIGFVVAMIGIKRSVLLTGISSVIIYALIMRGRSALVKGLSGFGILLIMVLAIYPKYWDIFLTRFESREKRIEISEETMESEARYKEIQNVLDTWINGSIRHKLIGSDIFNDRQFFNVNRMLHTDYMIILNGSGIIGFILWFFSFWVIIKSKNQYYRHLKNFEYFRQLNAIFYMYLASQLLISISGTIYNVELRSTYFLVWGAIIGTMRGEAIKIASFSKPENSAPITT
jgi:hypothetical protein